jgi:exodeoxyribonuclease VII large subunit
MDSISLSELSNRIHEAIRQRFDSPVWIRAEVSEMRENPNGHCYLELIEKDSQSDVILAKSKAIIWNTTYRMLKPYFETSTGQQFRAGLNVLVSVTVEFNGVYGFSLNVRDIDPSFTIGEMAARRLKIIRQLEADGIMDMNKELSIPTLPQRIAIISSPTAAGYGDFCDQLKSHSAQYVFYTKLFPAIMQGDHAEQSIIGALEKIYEHAELFDVVIIIRGGGATTDLACFDTYELALNCAQFPLPIISGIGHQRDVSILDLVAHTSVKTPTAVAEFLIEKLQDKEMGLYALVADIGHVIKRRIDMEKVYQLQSRQRIKHLLQKHVLQKTHLLDSHKQQLRNIVNLLIEKQHNRLTLLQKGIEIHSPLFLVKYGYTITTQNGKRLSSAKNLAVGDKIKTYFHDGEVESEIQRTK